MAFRLALVWFLFVGSGTFAAPQAEKHTPHKSSALSFAQTKANCQNHICQNGGTCFAICECAYCICPDGYTGDNCETALCFPPCQNGGYCNPGGNSCTCPPGFIGDLCQFPNPCTPSFCMNGGTCFPSPPDSWTCLCPPEYTGLLCNEENKCIPNPCFNGGTCYDAGFCLCPPGFTGSLCLTPDLCSPNPCQNGGTCYDPGVCACPPAWIGDNCQIPNPCYPDFCINGGTCNPSTDECICPPPYIGDFCESIDPCFGIDCNNGYCSNGQCFCLPGFTGEFCESITDPCVPNPCQNGGACIDPGQCICVPPFTGPFCEAILGPGQGYDCDGNNPCGLVQDLTGVTHWPHGNCSMFVQCDPLGRCYEKTCGPNQLWDICAHACNMPEAFQCPYMLIRCDFSKHQQSQHLQPKASMPTKKKSTGKHISTTKKATPSGGKRKIVDTNAPKKQ